MDFSETPIAKLIPQRPPMMMVDRMLSCDDVNAVAEFTIRHDNILLGDEGLSAPGIVENMAQSCAARKRCVDLLHGEPIKLGNIGEVRDAVILCNPQCGDTLHTYIHVVEDMFNVLLAEVRVEVSGKTMATALIKVAKTDIVANLSE